MGNTFMYNQRDSVMHQREEGANTSYAGGRLSAFNQMGRSYFMGAHRLEGGLDNVINEEAYNEEGSVNGEGKLKDHSGIDHQSFNNSLNYIFYELDKISSVLTSHLTYVVTTEDNGKHEFLPKLYKK